jgi:hypothetical protein
MAYDFTAYNGLGAEDKAILDAHQLLVRGLTSDFAKVLDQMVAMVAYWDAVVSTITSGMSGTDDIPVPTGCSLVGATPISITQLTNVTNAMDTISDPEGGASSYNTAALQQLYSLLCGPGNIT